MYDTNKWPAVQVSPPGSGVSQREVVEASELLGGAISSLDDAIKQLAVRLTPVAVQVPCNPCGTEDPASRFSCSLAQQLDRHIRQVNSIYEFVADLEKRVQL